MNYLSTFPIEELRKEIARRENDQVLNFRQENLNRNLQLSSDVVCLLAPHHSKKDYSECNKLNELTISGHSRCHRCSLEAISKFPHDYKDVRVEFTVDFMVSKQMSFK